MGKSRHCQDEGKRRNFITRRPALKKKKKTAKGNSINRNEMSEEGNLESWKIRRNKGKRKE